jgi:Arc/MetJ-type ribon-helix-helix transcriptional regulator
MGTLGEPVIFGIGPKIMTYQEQLDMLMADCVRKASAYIDAVIVNGQYDAQSDALRKELENAEASYELQLDRLRSQQLDLSEQVHELAGLAQLQSSHS